MNYCNMCFNATVDSSLRGKNDLHFSRLDLRKKTMQFIFEAAENRQLKYYLRIKGQRSRLI